MNIRKDESGNILIMTALCLSLLMGFFGLAIDVGLLYRNRQNVQIAADAAATAAALDYIYNASSSSAVSAGKAASSQNGFTDATNGATVVVNVPPLSGPVKSAGYAEAIVTQTSSLNFMRVLGFNNATVAARAVAGAPTTGTTCGYLTASNGTAMDLQGSYDIEAPGCGIYVNSSSSSAIKVTGNGGTVNAAYLDVVGSSTGHQTKPTPITTGVAARTDVFGVLNGPTTPAGCNITSAATTVNSANLGSVSGSSANPVVCFTNAVTLSGVTMPGTSSGVVYVFENGVSLSGTVSFGSGSYNSGTGTFSSTTGAVMEIQNGTLNQGNATLNIYAPTSGTYNGVAILQPAANTTQLQVQFGSSNETLDGYIYAPGAELFLQDNGGGVTATGFVAAELYDKSSTIRIPSYDTANPNTSPNRVVTLVE